MANVSQDSSVLNEDGCASFKNTGLQTEHSETGYMDMRSLISQS